MRLFIVDTNQTQYELFRIATKALTITANNLYVDGRKESDGNWYYYGNGYGKALAYVGLEFGANPGDGDALSAFSDGVQYRMHGTQKNSKNWFACEFK